MKRLLLITTAVLTALCASAQRFIDCLNFGWEFRLNDEGEWKKVDVPHDFQIEQPWVAPSADETADNTDVDSRRWEKATTACTTLLTKR